MAPASPDRACERNGIGSDGGASSSTALAVHAVANLAAAVNVILHPPTTNGVTKPPLMTAATILRRPVQQPAAAGEAAVARVGLGAAEVPLPPQVVIRWATESTDVKGRDPDCQPRPGPPDARRDTRVGRIAAAGARYKSALGRVSGPGCLPSGPSVSVGSIGSARA